jgi:RNA polymerase-binding transcription factor DksA
MSAARKPTSRKKNTTKTASGKGVRKTASRSSSDKKAAPKKTNAGPASGKRSSADKAAKKKTSRSAADRKKTAHAGRARPDRSTEAGRARPDRSTEAGRARPDRTADKPSKKTAARASARRSGRLDAKTVTKLRARLEEERRGLSAEMAELEEESFQTTQSDITGEAGVDEDFADAGTATFDREQALSIANNIRDLIGQVDRALARMDEGTYGACERCGRPIDPVRLRALPRTLLCAECKRREERAR